MLNILDFWRLVKGWPTSLQLRRMQLMLSESPNKRTKLTIWQQATMISLLFHVHTTYILVQFFAHIPFVVNRAFNVTPRGGNKTINCKIFAQTGFLLEKVQLKLMICSNNLHYIGIGDLGVIMIIAHTSILGVRWIFPWSGRKFFSRGPIVVKFDLINSKLRDRHFLTKT